MQNDSKQTTITFSLAAPKDTRAEIKAANPKWVDVPFTYDPESGVIAEGVPAGIFWGIDYENKCLWVEPIDDAGQ